MLGNYILTFALSILFSYILVPYIIRFAEKIGAIDIPKEKRKIHKTPTARIGGLAIIVSFIFSFIFILILALLEEHIDINFLLGYKIEFIGIIISIALIVFMGLYDDIKDLNPFLKLLFQMIIAAVTVFCGIRIDNINIFGSGMLNLNIYLSYIISFIWIISVMNAINLIDGLDCLSTGVVAIALSSLVMIFRINSSPIIAIFMAIPLIGSILGYMPYNITPAKTFVGDVGTNFLGYMLAIISIVGVAKTYTLAILIAPIISLLLPIADTIFAIIRRLIQNKSLKGVFKADRGHFHHRLLEKGFTPSQVVKVSYIITALAGLLAILLLDGNIYKIILFLILVSIFCIIGFKDILRKIKEGKEKYLNEAIEDKNYE